MLLLESNNLLCQLVLLLSELIIFILLKFEILLLQLEQLILLLRSPLQNLFFLINKLLLKTLGLRIVLLYLQP